MKYKEWIKNINKIVDSESTGFDEEYGAYYICTLESDGASDMVFIYVTYNEEHGTIFLTDLGRIKEYCEEVGKDLEKEKVEFNKLAEKSGIKLFNNYYILEVTDINELEESIKNFKAFIVPVIQSI